MLSALPLACGTSSPTSPSAPGGTAGGVAAAPLAADVLAAGSEDGSTLKVSAPIPQSPIDNVEVEILQLRPTLIVSNATHALGRFVSGASFPHEFQVLRVEPSGSLTLVDSGSVPQGVGETSFVVQTVLDDVTPHRWRARVAYEGAHGPWSDMASFRTKVPVGILVPTLLQPAPGQVVDTLRPILEIENPELVGDPGTVFIEFQVASDPGFQDIVAVMAEEMGKHAGIDTPLTGPRQTILAAEEKTSAQPNVDLTPDTTYYWRARGTNGSVATFPAAAAPGSVLGEFSAGSFFQIATNARGFSGTGQDEIDLSQVVWLHENVSSWPQTSTILSTAIGDPPICIDHTKLAQWPRADFSGSGRIVDSNAWVFATIGGTWYAATWEWFLPGEVCKGLGRFDFMTHVGGLAPLNTWVPQSGEQIGFMVSTPARHGNGPVNERSNVVLATWP